MNRAALLCLPLLLAAAACTSTGTDARRDPAPSASTQPAAVEVLGFHIKATDPKAVSMGGQVSQDAIQRCAQRPDLQNVVQLQSLPVQWTGRVVGQDNADALKDCVAAVAGWGLTFAPYPDTPAFKAYTVRPSATLVLNTRLAEEREACFALPGVRVIGQGESQPVIYRVNVGLGQSLAFEQFISKVAGLYVPELDGPPPTLAAGAGEAATWAIDPKAPPQPDATMFTALVSRVACNSGETGEVLRPRIEETPDRVVVTFTVAPQPPGTYGCPGNKHVRVEVRLAEPVGKRVIEDGACRMTLQNGQPVCRDAMRYPVRA